MSTSSDSEGTQSDVVVGIGTEALQNNACVRCIQVMGRGDVTC